MFPAAALLSWLLVALSTVSAIHVKRASSSTLAFSTGINGFIVGNIADVDRARAQALRGLILSRRTDSVSVTNSAMTYTASVGVGSPPTDYTLMIDTSSSNTWIGAATSYSPTDTSSDTGNTVSISSAGFGTISGKEYIDTVTLSSSLVVANQSIGVVSKQKPTASGFSNVDGVLGIGPVALTKGTVSNTQSVPTVTDNLLTQGTISSNVLGIYFAPSSQSSDGELTFGGIDTTKTTSSVAYVPITSTSPASSYWGIDQSITYGTTSILSNTAGIVDSGITLVLIATDAFHKYQEATNATLDPASGLLMISSEQYSALEPLNFHIGDATYTLSANAQIWPRSLNAKIGGTDGNIYLVVADLGSNSGTGLDFINGYTFLERFYSVYDTTNSRVGFANTIYTTATTN